MKGKKKSLRAQEDIIEYLFKEEVQAEPHSLLFNKKNTLEFAATLRWFYVELGYLIAVRVKA